MNADLSDNERRFLAFALDLAADQMASRDGFTNEDDAALTTFRHMAAEPDSTGSFAALSELFQRLGPPPEGRAAAATDLTPIPLRWDRLVMHPDGSQDDQTIVCCLTDDGRPAALFLDDEYREALGGILLDPNPDDEATTP